MNNMFLTKNALLKEGGNVSLERKELIMYIFEINKSSS